MTTNEFAALALFARNPGKVFSRDEILQKLRGIDCDAFNMLAGICVNIVVVGFLGIHRGAAGRPLHKNILQYLNYLIDDLGSPPNLDRARQIGEQASLQIYADEVR